MLYSGTRLSLLSIFPGEYSAHDIKISRFEHNTKWKSMAHSNDMMLAAIAGTDLARLAIPKIPDISKMMLSGDYTARLKLISSQMRKASQARQSVLTGLAPQLTAIARAIENTKKQQVTAFQTIAQKIHPIISQQTKMAHDLSRIAVQVSPVMEAIKTLSSYNAYLRYKETYNEFGGDLDPDNISEEEIEHTIENNSEFIQEVNEIIIQAEDDGAPPGDIPELVYKFLIKRLPNLSKRTYSIIVLIFCSIILVYQLHSTYSTNKALDDVIIPKLEQNSKAHESLSVDHGELKEELSDNLDALSEIQEKVDSTQVTSESIKRLHEETNDKLDLILEEMRKNEE
jgi:hypothetical protein